MRRQTQGAFTHSYTGRWGMETGDRSSRLVRESRAESRGRRDRPRRCTRRDYGFRGPTARASRRTVHMPTPAPDGRHAKVGGHDIGRRAGSEDDRRGAPGGRAEPLLTGREHSAQLCSRHPARRADRRTKSTERVGLPPVADRKTAATRRSERARPGARPGAPPRILFGRPTTGRQQSRSRSGRGRRLKRDEGESLPEDTVLEEATSTTGRDHRHGRIVDEGSLRP